MAHAQEVLDVNMNQLARLLARDRERNGPQDMSVQRSPSAPDIGLLSRTLIPSSMTKWIIPARLTGGDNIELLFVGENHIHIHEVVPDVSVDFRLRHRQTLPYIASSIRSIALLGGSNVTRSSQHDTKLPSLAEQMAKIDIPELERQEYPIQILVIALESGHLQLLTPDLDDPLNDEYIKFKWKRLPLPWPEPRATSPGTRITVDPFSRAFAVAAAFDHLVVYNTRDRALLSANLTANKDDWNPVSEEKFLQIPGRLVGMEFLNPGAQSNEVIMIVLTAKGRRNGLTCYAWDPSEGFRNFRTILMDQKVPGGTESLCNMIIPMANTPDFLLIHGDTIDLCTGILTGRTEMRNVDNKKSNWDADPSFPASSKRRPQFTAWARPGRVPQFKEEFVFFIREDGVVRHYSRHSGRTVPVGEVGNSGDLNCHVDTAFASFCPSPQLPDYVIAAGDMSNGEFHSVGVNMLRQPSIKGMKKDIMGLVKLTTMPDWAPIMDMQLCRSGGDSTRPALTVTSGRQPFGAVSELRLGHQADINRIVDFEDDLVGASNIWILSEDEERLAHCICAYPGQTIAVTISVDGDVLASDLRVSQDQEAIFAGVFQGFVTIVTSNMITLQRFDGSQAAEEKSWPEHIVLASCDEEFLVLATQDGHVGSRVQILGEDLKALDQELLTEELTTLLVDDIYLVAATREGRVLLYLLDRDNGRLTKSSEVDISSVGIVQSFAWLESTLLCGTREGVLWAADIITDDSKSASPSSDSNMQVDRIDVVILIHHRTFRIGHGPVLLSKDATATRAFITCDRETLFAVLGGSDDRDLIFERFVLTSVDDEAFPTPRLAAMASLPVTKFDGQSGIVCDEESEDVRLICHDGTRMLLATMYHEQKVLPRRRPLRTFQTSLEPNMPPHDTSGTPTKLFYSNMLEAIITSGVKYEHKPSRKVPEPGWQGSRLSRGFLSIIPANSNQDITPDDISWNRDAIQMDFAPAERVLCACEWKFERGGSRHPYLVVGTSIHKGEMKMIDGKLRRLEHGRLWVFIPSRDEKTGRLALVLKYIKNFEERPVRALAVLDKTKLLVAPHGELRVYSFVDAYFSQQCKVDLPSPAIHITTSEGRKIFMTTSQHSVCAYEYTMQQFVDSQIPKLEQIFSDNVQRTGISHLLLELEKSSGGTDKGQPANGPSFTTATQSQRAAQDSKFDVLLGADKNGQVFGLDVPKTRRNQSAAPTIFELRLPQSITKFVRGSIRAPWHEREHAVCGVVADNIIGATTNGTVYHFTVLTNKARCLLKFLENLVRWNERQDFIVSKMQELRFERASRRQNSGRGFTEQNDKAVPWVGPDLVIDPEYVPGEVGTHQRRDQYGINGDYLLPLLADRITGPSRSMRLHGMLLREEILSREDEDRALSSRHTGNASIERCRRFEQLARKVEQVQRAYDVNGIDIHEACLQWVDEVMRPVL